MRGRREEIAAPIYLVYLLSPAANTRNERPGTLYALSKSNAAPRPHWPRCIPAWTLRKPATPNSWKLI